MSDADQVPFPCFHVSPEGVRPLTEAEREDLGRRQAAFADLAGPGPRRRMWTEEELRAVVREEIAAARQD